MTEKQLQILDTAIHLFILRGYYGTTTKQIAIEAQVSEGLIFKHFKNKEGLFGAVCMLIDETIANLISGVFNKDEPKEILRSALSLPFNQSRSNLNYWYLNFKFSREMPNHKSNGIQKLHLHLNHAFTNLNYKQPKLETDLFVNLLEFCITKRFRKQVDDESTLLTYLYHKYYL